MLANAVLSRGRGRRDAPDRLPEGALERWRRGTGRFGGGAVGAVHDVPSEEVDRRRAGGPVGRIPERLLHVATGEERRQRVPEVSCATLPPASSVHGAGGAPRERCTPEVRRLALRGVGASSMNALRSDQTGNSARDRAPALPRSYGEVTVKGARTTWEAPDELLPPSDPWNLPPNEHAQGVLLYYVTLSSTAWPLRKRSDRILRSSQPNC